MLAPKSIKQKKKTLSEALQHELNFSMLFKRSKSGMSKFDGGSPGLEEDRRGGVGEGL